MPNGMLMDYADLKGMVKPLVDELDHGFMCSEDDSLMKEFLKTTRFKVIHVNFYTTAENIAIYFLEQIKQKLSSHSNLNSLSIRVSETVSTYAEVSRPL